MAQKLYSRVNKADGFLAYVDLLWIAKALHSDVADTTALQARLDAGEVLETTLARFAKEARGDPDTPTPPGKPGGVLPH